MKVEAVVCVPVYHTLVIELTATKQGQDCDKDGKLRSDGVEKKKKKLHILGVGPPVQPTSTWSIPLPRDLPNRVGTDRQQEQEHQRGPAAHVCRHSPIKPWSATETKCRYLILAQDPKAT